MPQTVEHAEGCPYCHSGREEWDYFRTLPKKGSGSNSVIPKPFSNPYFREFSLSNLPITRLDEDIRRIIYNRNFAPNTSVHKGRLNERWYELNISEWKGMTKFNQEGYIAERINENEFLKEMEKLQPANIPIKLAFPRFDPRQNFHSQSLNILGLIDLARLTIWLNSKEYSDNASLAEAVEKLKQERTTHPHDIFRTFKSNGKSYVSCISSWYITLFGFLQGFLTTADGLPDFIVYNTANDFFFFVECKANTSQLSSKQWEVKNWIERYRFPYLIRHGEVEVTINFGETKYLNSKGVNDQSIQNLIDKYEKEISNLKSKDAIERRREIIRTLKRTKT